MEVAREVPLPSLQELGGYLPNQRFPSDHLPVVFDLRFRAAGSAGGGSSSDSAIAGGAANASGGGGCAGSNVLPAAFYSVPVAVEAVARGEVIAVPTDTIYGVAACAASAEGVAAVYATKQREPRKPLAICVADVADIERYASISHLAPGLLEDLLPGPVTLLLPRRSGAPLAEELTAGAEAVGVRIPDNPFLRAVCRQHRGALALTSANLSGASSSLAVREFEGLWPACAAVFDGGRLESGRSGSTVVDLTQPGAFGIVREGESLDTCCQLLAEKYGLEKQQPRP